MTSDHTPASRRLDHPWSVPLRFEEVPLTGSHIALTPDERTRQAIAATAGLRTLPRLEATFEVTRSGADGLRVSGQVSATVGQTCVVTLEPVDSEVVEAFDIVYKPAPGPVAGEDLEISARTEEVEPLIDGTIDLGAIATEFLFLGIDPYPRKPGAVFEPPSSGEPAGGAFAALAALKKKPPN
jgi:uncharacterized metal-binding protein YceD (DUF177 family)